MSTLFAWEFRLLLATLPMVAVILLGAAIIAWAKRYFQRSKEVPGVSQQLAHFRSLYEAGEITKEEYESVRALLGNKLRQELNVPAAGEAKPDKPRPGDSSNGAAKDVTGTNGKD
ncbi:MAG: hypothetical protein KatS3mg105_1877 [Gemmatales bacterium]|nr:MAG: hypothetical protein KatS3mg105_1877 [Gemmatales bacterium]